MNPWVYAGIYAVVLVAMLLIVMVGSLYQAMSTITNILRSRAGMEGILAFVVAAAVAGIMLVILQQLIVGNSVTVLRDVILPTGTGYVIPIHGISKLISERFSSFLESLLLGVTGQ